jgi:benzoyl-CoA reductase/2-hydroxyglutaryl-CoA dehydratase subunit BcrC/BadD/HgdB
MASVQSRVLDRDMTAWESLHDAYMRPWLIADEWRRLGGRVVGVLGNDLPREVVAAGGLLPVRLSPVRLDRGGKHHADAVPEGLAAQLTPPTSLVLGALMTGELDWIDALAIGRDSETHADLFYVIRELVRTGEGAGFPPFVFCDHLRLARRQNREYNRLRIREFATTISEWAPRTIDADSLFAAIGDRIAVSERLSALNDLRTRRPSEVSGSQMLVATGAAQAMPALDATGLLATAESEREHEPESLLRILVTGSGQDDLWVYRALEQSGATVVAEDHEWGPDLHWEIADSPDPWDALADRYLSNGHGAARSGLWERTARTAAAARTYEADGVLQIVFDHDEAAPWELPGLRTALGSGTPVVQVRLRYGEENTDALVEAVSVLASEVQHV